MSLRRLLQRLHRDERGFSLVELTVSMIFLGIISATFTMLLSSTIRHQREIQEQSTTQSEVRDALDRMTREIRQAYQGGGAWPIEAISASQIKTEFEQLQDATKQKLK